MLTETQARAFAAEANRLVSALEASVIDAERGASMDEATRAIGIVSSVMIDAAARVVAASNRLDRFLKTPTN